MPSAATIPYLTLLLAALSLLVSLVVLRILTLQSRDGRLGLKKSAQLQPGRLKNSGLLADFELVAVLTAAITAAQADEANERQLTAAITGALSADMAANGTTAGFVIRKIKRV
ncbi:MAG: hypothetical protein PHC86_01855 [Eubacteriales bacterium]|nr:hypothetical protein [Eubacteriales bacterium]